MLPDMDVMSCRDLAVPMGVMQHVVNVESSFNRYAIGVVGGRLARQPGNLAEALATARMLRERGFNFSLGLAQINRYNLGKFGLSLERAFDACANLRAGARILADCRLRSGNDWGKALSCYYSGNFVTGFRDGYVQKVFASVRVPAAPRLIPHALPLGPGARAATRVGQMSAVAVEPVQSTLIARRATVSAGAVRAEPAVTAPAPPRVSETLAAAIGSPPPGVHDSPETAPKRIDEAFIF